MGIEPGTSGYVVRNSDHWITEAVFGRAYGVIQVFYYVEKREYCLPHLPKKLI
jgi:hypothetical protein